MLCRAPLVPHVPLARTLAIPALRLAQGAALRHAPSPASSSCAPALRTAHPRDALRLRSFSSTPQRAAEESPALQGMFAQQQKLLKLFQAKPELVESMQAFVTLLKDNGVDVTSGKVPSKTEMFRLLMKTEIRESAMKMATAFQEAGLDLSSKEMMQSLMTMQKELGVGGKK